MSLIDPDWIDPIESTFDAEKPIRQEQGLMLAGNPIAMAAGKAGAPRVAQKVILPSSGVGTNTLTFTVFDGWQGALISAEISLAASGDAFNIALGDDSTFAANEVIFTASGAIDTRIQVFADFATGGVKAFYGTAGTSSVTAATPAGVVTRIRLQATGGSSAGAEINGMAIANGGASAS